MPQKRIWRGRQRLRATRLVDLYRTPPAIDLYGAEIGLSGNAADWTVMVQTKIEIRKSKPLNR